MTLQRRIIRCIVACCRPFGTRRTRDPISCCPARSIIFASGSLWLLLAVGCQHTAEAQERPFGLGVMAGEPLGISMLAWLSDAVSLNGGVGWSLHGDRIGRINGPRRFHLHVDLIRHSFEPVRQEDRYPVFAGIGVRLNSGAGLSTTFTLRGVAGISWMPHTAPLDLFMELVPMVQLNSPAGVGIEAGVGMRYLF